MAMVYAQTQKNIAKFYSSRKSNTTISNLDVGLTEKGTIQKSYNTN